MRKERPNGMAQPPPSPCGVAQRARMAACVRAHEREWTQLLPDQPSDRGQNWLESVARSPAHSDTQETRNLGGFDS
eukprot:9681413-Alexandrium_andersonii.AAC.1